MRRLTRIEIVLLFLVIIAGSVVRMTGSGMGCPDWPRCFGYLVPPTEQATLEWSPDRSFQKGQMIVRDEALYVAQDDFTTGPQYEASHWEKYTRHDYAHFNPTHTWIEYINRLFGALSGLPMLALFILSFFALRQDLRLLALSAAGIFMLGFEAWLGKKVVDGNLIPGSITIHMLGAFSVVAIVLLLQGVLSQAKLQKRYYTLWFKYGLILALVLILVQVVLGTQVREQIDVFNRMGLARQEWVGQLDVLYYVHRSFSLLIMAVLGWLWWENRRHRFGFWQFPLIMVVLLVEVLAGVVLAYFDMPAWAQPVHLLLGTILFALHFHALVHFSLGPSQRVIPIR